MALIECPQCKKPISDSAKTCVHCGFDFIMAKRKEQAAKDYINLSLERKDELDEEFYSQFPHWKTVEDKLVKLNASTKRIRILMSVSGFLTLAIIFIGRLIKNRAPYSILLALALIAVILILFILVMVGLLIRNIVKNKKMKRDSFMQLKVFQVWLQERYGIRYTLLFGKKARKYIDGLTISKSDMEKIKNGTDKMS